MLGIEVFASPSNLTVSNLMEKVFDQTIKKTKYNTWPSFIWAMQIFEDNRFDQLEKDGVGLSLKLDIESHIFSYWTVLAFSPKDNSACLDIGTN